MEPHSTTLRSCSNHWSKAWAVERTIEGSSSQSKIVAYIFFKSTVDSYLCPLHTCAPLVCSCIMYMDLPMYALLISTFSGKGPKQPPKKRRRQSIKRQSKKVSTLPCKTELVGQPSKKKKLVSGHCMLTSLRVTVSHLSGCELENAGLTIALRVTVSHLSGCVVTVSPPHRTCPVTHTGPTGSSSSLLAPL